MKVPRRSVLQADDLTRELRIWLLARAAMYGADVVATTLVYELTAVIARCSDTVADADALIDQWAAAMKDQIRAFGVGDEHP